MDVHMFSGSGFAWGVGVQARLRSLAAETQFFLQQLKAYELS